MLTNEDINKLLGVLASKDDIKQLEGKFDALQENVQALTIAVDNLVKGIGDLKQEYTMVTSAIHRHEKWIQQLAEKLGVTLES